MNNLELQRKSLPHEPGVYLYHDKNGKIIYVGKAIDLRKRVSSYFLKTSYNDPYYEDKIKRLVKQISSIDFIVTENEKEAYILENILIKKHLPPFNVFMRDSKSYPWIMITYSEEFPRVQIMRNPDKYSQQNLFLGPYTDKKEIRRILRDLRKLFPYCSCKKKIKNRKRACLYYQLKLCPGPCIDEISKEEYMENIKKIELFLKGDTEQLKTQIRDKMNHAAQDQNYEAAAFWRDKLEAIDHSTASQYVLLAQEEDKDIIGLYIDKNEKYAAMVIIHIREGKITNKSPFIFDIRVKPIEKKDIFPSIIEQYYQGKFHYLPDDIIVPHMHEDLYLLNEVLKDMKSDLVIRTVYNDNEGGLLRIAEKNAQVMVKQEIEMEEIKQKEVDVLKKALEEAQDLLDLPSFPHVIEGFDISNIEGKNATGSMVYFLDGRPYTKNYRHYKIYSKSSPDDVGMMKEVIERRYSKLLEYDKTLPDLILVDGGKGQLNGAKSVLDDLGLNIPIIGLAKRFEEIFIPNEKEPLILPESSQLLKIFQQVRDEAHRFAVRLHKKQRKKTVTGSALDEIKGVGPATRNKLLKHFGSLSGIKEATEKDLQAVVNVKLAKKIKKELK